MTVIMIGIMKMNKKKKFEFKSLLPYLLFLLGLLIAVYPIISDRYYRIQSNDEINEYIRTVSKMEEEELNRRWKLAEAYNKTLDPSRLADPFSKEEKEGRAEYARMIEIQEKIGYIEVPKIGQDLPIYAGTAESILQKGAGHLEGTSLPIGGESTHSVITAHRGLPSAKLFSDLDKMENGDKFFIHILDKVLAYEVDQILTVDPSDFDPVLVVEGEDYSTLLTCTPYSINSHRLLVRGHRIDYTAPVEEKELKQLIPNNDYRYYLIISFLVILVLVYLIYRNRKALKAILRRLEGENKDE